MFISKKRPVIFPQHEHARLASHIACLWGNKEFKLPGYPLESLIAATLLHDHLFGYYDSLPIGSIPDDLWIRLVRESGITDEINSLPTRLLVYRHLEELANMKTTPARAELARELRKEIKSCLSDDRSTRELEAAYSILSFCDSVSFDFCFEQKTKRTLPVFCGPETGTLREVSYEVDGEGNIFFDPMPLCSNNYSSFITAYEKEEYPRKLTPVIVGYKIGERVI